MSEITLNILDSERSISSRIHGGIGDRIVAALAADPETVEELERALDRTMKLPHDDFFRCWHHCLCYEPWDAGLMYIDLAARLIACESTYSSPSRKGTVAWHDGTSATSIQLKYRLADDWHIFRDVDSFQGTSQVRRRERSGTPPLDVRPVLYEKLPEFIVCELEARREELAGLDEDTRYELIKELHARWLLAPRTDLRGASPRDILLEKKEHIGSDICNQKHFWSFVGCPPPGIGRESHAYRFGGFGTHEIVLYYNLARYLFAECFDRLSGGDEPDRAAEVERLDMLCQEWMHTPQDDLSGRSPAHVIDRERMRLPMAASGDEAVVDPDCPLCHMMADESFGPTFWNLDGCNMDWEFAFSLHQTKEQWEEEQRDYEDFSRKCDQRRRQEEQREREFVDGSVPLENYMEHEASVWKSSYSNLAATDELPPWHASRMILFGIGCHLGELCQSLNADEADRERAAHLREGLTQLRHAVDRRVQETLVSEVAGFRDHLVTVAEVRTELHDRCRDLLRHVDRLVERCEEASQHNERFPPGDDDIPF